MPVSGAATERGIWAARGGRGEPLMVLLHGMGANASVWERLLPLVERSWRGRWLAPDLRGHGRSVQEGPYGIGAHASDVAAIIEAEAAGAVTLVGHSFGGAVAALVASGWFGPRVGDVAAFGVKIEWSEAEIEKARGLALRPAPVFATREEAIERYLRLSGLAGLAAPSSATATRWSPWSKCGASIPPPGPSPASGTTRTGRLPSGSGSSSAEGADDGCARAAPEL